MSERAADWRERAAREPGAVLLQTTRARRDGRFGPSYCFSEPVEWLEARRLDELPPLFARLEAARAAGLWAAGYLSYECGYHWEPTAFAPAWPRFVPAPGGLPLASLGLYRAPAMFVPEASAGGTGLAGGAFGISEAAFAEKVGAIRGWIEAGDSYQVNLTDAVEAEYGGDAGALFAHMMAAQPVEFGAMLHLPGGARILSASPELFFERRGCEITVRPMKGTCGRGADAEEDDRLAQALAGDEKNRAENLMIVDLLRSDLGRVAAMGSVRVERLFAVERFPTLLQMSSEIRATLRTGVGLYEIFGALFPSGSIVGAPKVRTMQILRRLEGRERGVYTGAIGYVEPGGDAVFSVAIRTAVLAGGRLRMGVGAGITWDSVAADEYAECLLKARFLCELPGGCRCG